VEGHVGTLRTLAEMAPAGLGHIGSRNLALWG